MMCAAHRAGKTRWLAGAAQAALNSGRSAEQILALTVHQPAANVLRETLLATTSQPIATTTLRRRALLILESSPAVAYLPAGWQPTQLLSGIDRRLLIRQAWSSAAANERSLFAQRGSQPGALDWIVRLFDQLSEWCGSADPRRLPALQIADPALAELWRAYQIYLELCRRHGLIAFSEVFNRAIDVLRAQPPAAPQLLLLDDLDLCRPAELLLLDALIAPTTDVHATATYAPNIGSAAALDRYLARWAARLSFTIAEEPLTVRPPALSIGEYATPDAEAHAIAQRIATHELTARGQIDAFAIVAFDSELTALLQRVLPQYGLPVEGQDGRDGYALALAPLALAGLKLLAEQPLTLAEIIALLRHPALGLSAADAHSVVEAIQHRRWQPFAETAESSWPPELSAAGRSRLLALRQTTAELRAAELRPSALLRQWLRSLDLDRRAWQQSEQALEPWAVALDRRHWERWIGFVEQSEALREALGAPLTLADALEVLISAQALVEREGRPHDRAVALWQPTTLGGCTAQVVFVAGLHEGALPLPVATLPLTNDDAALAAAFGALPGFVAPQLADRAAAWQRGAHDLRRAIGRGAAEVHLSYSRSDQQERRRLPSPVLAALIGGQIDRDGRLSAVDESLAIETEPRGADARGARRTSPALIEPLAQPLPDLTADESPFPVSPSMIEDYFTCPRRCYYARRLDLYDVSSSPRQALGMVTHSALDDLLRMPDVDDAEQLAVRLVARHWISDDQRWGTRLKQTVFRQLAETAVAHVARAEREASAPAEFVGGELAFRWPLAGSDVIVHGRIDRIDRTAAGLHVIDYKLGQHSPSINALLHEFVEPRDPLQAARWRPGDIQLPVYALAIEQGEVDGLERLSGERVVSVALIYPLELYGDSGKASAKGRREIELIEHGAPCRACEAPGQARPKVGTLCRSQLAAVERLVRAAVAGMRAGEWPANPREGGRTCAGCVFRPICSDPQ
jgi:superfamily I DNA/RNA helicase